MELRARILMRVDSGRGWKGGSFSRFYKMFHFVDSFTGEAAFLEGRIARPAATKPSHGDVFHGSKAAGFQ